MEFGRCKLGHTQPRRRSPLPFEIEQPARPDTPRQAKEIVLLMIEAVPRIVAPAAESAKKRLRAIAALNQAQFALQRAVGGL